MRRDNKAALDIPVYRALLESGPDALIATDPQGTILFANGQADRLFGYGKGDLEGNAIEVIIPERLREYHVAHRRAFLADPKLRPMGTGMELLALKKDGTEFPVEISLSPIETPSGPMVAAAVRDISARKKVERTLHKAKEDAERANLTKSRFLAAASHDLRQPLQATQMYLTALSQLLQDDSGYELIHRMQLSTNSLTEILDSLLDIARLDTGQVEPELVEFPILDLMQKIVADSMVHARDKNLQIRLVPSNKQVYSDRGLLGSILGNLLSNAVGYTASGRVLIGCRADGNHLRIQVWDTGSGIPAESRDSIFEEYFQLEIPNRNRNRGPGLGLSIVKRLANLLNYPIELQSRLHKGSMFSVRVPLAQNSEGHIPTKTPLDIGETTISILFIHDDPDVGTATSTTLKLHGYGVHTASNGQEAYDHIADQGLVPDIILLDCRLPGNESGMDIVRRIRTLLSSEIPAVFVAGDTLAEVIKDTNIPNCEVVDKPVDPQKLNAALLDGLIASSVYTVH
jgi:PAS domain S-box-containing protein